MFLHVNDPSSFSTLDIPAVDLFRPTKYSASWCWDIATLCVMSDKVTYTDSAVTRFLDSLVRVVGAVVYVVLALFTVSAFVFLSWGAWREGGWIGLSVYWGLVLCFVLYLYSESRR